jgi:transposase
MKWYSRMSKDVFERLEPCALKGARTVLRGLGAGNRVWLPDEAWLHAEVPRVDCSACGKTTQAEVPWARPGSGFTLLFEALALSLCQTLPVAQAADQLRVASKRLWRRIEHYVGIARQHDEMTGVRVIGIDETSVKKGHNYVTVVHDLEAKRLLFITAGRDHETVAAFKQDLIAHGGAADD